MSDKQNGGKISALAKCFWLDLAAAVLLIAGFVLLDVFAVSLSDGMEKLAGVLAMAPSWVLSLFALNAWSGIPDGEKEELNRRFGRFVYKLEPGFLVWVLPVALPVVALCAAILD